MVLDLLKGKWLGHPLHPILAHIPVALWPASLVTDLLSLIIARQPMLTLSFMGIFLGLLASLLAVPTGVADWSEIRKEKPAWKLGLAHMILNLFLVVLFAINMGLRIPSLNDTTQVMLIPFSLSAIGTVVLLISAYLGGRMVFHHGIGIARMSKEELRKAAELGGANLPPEKEEQGSS